MWYNSGIISTLLGSLAMGAGQSGTMQYYLRVACVGCALLTAAPSARAAFVNGVERFDGTSLDLTTWERFNPSLTSYSQNDALMITGVGTYSDYTTRAVSVSIGQRVTAEVSVVLPQNEPTAYFGAGLLLTDDSAGTAKSWPFDSRYFGCLIAFNSSPDNIRAFELVDGGSGFYGAGYFANGVAQAGVTYLLSVQRDSAQQYVVAASQADGTPIFSQVVKPDPDQQDLRIALVRSGQGFASNCAGTYDNVTITTVPEPVLIPAACVAFSVLGRVRPAAKKR